MIKSKVCM